MMARTVTRCLASVASGMLISLALAADDPPARGTWTRQPATRWEAGFLTGNGRMGAIVFGQPADETIVLNHCRMYRPLGSPEIVPDLTDGMDEARQAAKTGGPGGFHNFVRQKCHELGWRSIIWTDPFHPAGVPKLAMKDPPKDARDYRMSEDFMTGELAVRWDDSRGLWRRLFISRPDNVAVLALQGPPGAVSFDLALEIGHAEIQASIRSEPAPQDAWMTAHCVYVKGKGGYDLAVRVVPQGEAGKYVKDSELPYNEVARKVMAEEGIAVIDLWDAVKPQLEKLQISRNVHFHAAGSAALAKQVAQSIQAALPRQLPESRK